MFVYLSRLVRRYGFKNRTATVSIEEKEVEVAVFADQVSIISGPVWNQDLGNGGHLARFSAEICS